MKRSYLRDILFCAAPFIDTTNALALDNRPVVWRNIGNITRELKECLSEKKRR